MKTYDLLILCIVFAVGVAVFTGLANAVDQADEKATIADSWLVNGPVIDVETTTGQVMFRRTVNSDAARQLVEGLSKGLDGVNSVKEVIPSSREAVKANQGSMAFDVKKGRVVPSPGLHTRRVKMMILYSLCLRSMRPLGHM